MAHVPERNEDQDSIKNITTISVEELIGPLNEIEKKYAPLWLYIAGDRRIAKINPRISVIGSRHPSQEGLKNAENLVRYLITRNAVIVSGLALGIDTTAHKIAITNGGKTIAVLGNPLDQCYPKENYDLQKEIIRNHLAVSQFKSGHPIQPRNFPMRNRTMALISDASIVVEAGDSSGSLSQGWETLRLGRPLFILDTVLNNKELLWPRKMIDYGAKLLSLKKMAEQLFEFLPSYENMADTKNVTLYT